MNVFGVGGLELVVVMLVALFVVGPVRLVEGARTARKYLEEIRRQRDELTQMIEDAADIEGVKAALDQDGLIGEVQQAAAEITNFRDEAVAASDDLRELQDVAATLRRPLGNRPAASSVKAASREGAEPTDAPVTDGPTPDGLAAESERVPTCSSNGVASAEGSASQPPNTDHSPSASKPNPRATASESNPPASTNGAASVDGIQSHSADADLHKTAPSEARASDSAPKTQSSSKRSARRSVPAKETQRNRRS